MWSEALWKRSPKRSNGDEIREEREDGIVIVLNLAEEGSGEEKEVSFELWQVDNVAMWIDEAGKVLIVRNGVGAGGHVDVLRNRGREEALFLHSDIWKYFLFTHKGKKYWFMALKMRYWWGSSLFSKLLILVMQRLHEKLRYRMLSYVDKFSINLSQPERASTVKHCVEAREVAGLPMGKRRLQRHPTRVYWKGSRWICHLRM